MITWIVARKVRTSRLSSSVSNSTNNGNKKRANASPSPCAIGPGLGEALARFLFPLLVELDTLLDKRLVRTFLATIQVIITFRDRANGLLLSELGGYLERPDKAPAGTKRLSNLLHSCKWTAKLLACF